MKNKINVGFVAAVLAVLFIPVVSFAQTAPQEVMEVFIIDASEATAPLAPLIDRFVELNKKHNSPSERALWFNAHAGAQTGVFISTIRWPSIAAFAADPVPATPEAQALQQELFQTGFKVVSRSLIYGGVR
jgi:hypothetical protein